MRQDSAPGSDPRAKREGGSWETPDKRGFTLLEITLVIVIGIVLVAGANAAFQSYRNQARVTQGKLNLATMRQAMSMARYRTGADTPLGYLGNTTGSLTSSSTVVNVSSGTTLTNLPAGTTLCFGGTGTGTVQAKVNSIGVNQIGIRDVTNLTGTLASPQIVRAGILGNVDDQCNKLVPIPDPNPTVPGMGLSDPWLGYTNVRPSPRPDLPEYVPGTGFKYNPTRTTDVWGGLAFISNGQVEVVLPAPNLTPSPPANLGRFPGDPPINWGK